MDRVDVQRMIEVLDRVRDLLHDVAQAPISAVPPGLWRPLAEAVAELGDPLAAVNQQQLDTNGFWTAVPPPAGQQHQLLARAAQIILTEHGIASFEHVAQDHGLSGRQLDFKMALLDHAHADYVAHGRVTELPKNDPMWMRRSARNLRRALGPCQTVVGSLSHLPGLGMLGLVGELLEATGHTLDIGTDPAASIASPA